MTDTVQPKIAVTTSFNILLAISVCHLLNDMIQSLLPAIYPMLKTAFRLDFAEIGIITLTFQLTASLLQPLVGIYTDRRSSPYSLVIGMGSTLCGLLLLANAWNYPSLLLAAALVGTGSSVFHPESSRVARMASGGRPGLAQSIFQVGGNLGSASGPLLAAFVILPGGQSSIAWFSLAAVTAIAILARVGAWYQAHQAERPTGRSIKPQSHPDFTSRQVAVAITILLVMVFSKTFYTASMGSYFTFYLIQKFSLTPQEAQIHLFYFLGATAFGTIVGGPIGDRFGRRYVIWWSILGVLPFTLLLPVANLFWTSVLSVLIGMVMASAFPAILVYAQELLPGRVGMVSGIFFGLSFGLGGIGAAVLGAVADHTSITFVYQLCSILPALGLVAYFLPRISRPVAV